MSHKYDNLRNEVEQIAREKQISPNERRMLLYRIDFVEKLEQETIDIVNSYDSDSRPETMREKILKMVSGGR